MLEVLLGRSQSVGCNIQKVLFDSLKDYAVPILVFCNKYKQVRFFRLLMYLKHTDTRSSKYFDAMNGLFQDSYERMINFVCRPLRAGQQEKNVCKQMREHFEFAVFLPTRTHLTE